MEGDPASVDALTKARLSQAQALIIGGSSTAQPKEADAFTLTTITLAQVRNSSIDTSHALITTVSRG